MKTKGIECVRCGATHQFHLSGDETSHLRNCPECGLWWIIHESAADLEADVTGLQIEPLGDPPICPVGSCEEELTEAAVPEHIIEQHDGSLRPSS